MDEQPLNTEFPMVVMVLIKLISFSLSKLKKAFAGMISVHPYSYPVPLFSDIGLAEIRLLHPLNVYQSLMLVTVDGITK